MSVPRNGLQLPSTATEIAPLAPQALGSHVSFAVLFVAVGFSLGLARSNPLRSANPGTVQPTGAMLGTGGDEEDLLDADAQARSRKIALTVAIAVFAAASVGITMGNKVLCLCHLFLAAKPPLCLAKQLSRKWTNFLFWLLPTGCLAFVPSLAGSTDRAGRGICPHLGRSEGGKGWALFPFQGMGAGCDWVSC